MNEPTKLDETRVKILCNARQGKAICSFLIMAGGAGMCCAKGSSMENVILGRRSTMKSQGDNCSGPPDFTPNENPSASNLELWQRVAARTDLIGGDVEAKEGGMFYRGPIKYLEIIDEKYVFFTMEWSAKRNNDSEEWTNHFVTSLATEIESTRPDSKGNGPVHFTLQFLGLVTLFPKGQNNLNPASVKGLKLET